MIFLDADDTSFLSPNIAVLRYYEAATTELWRRLARASSVVVDVGANIGWFTVAAARSAPPSSRVIAFEPEPRAFTLLARTVATNNFRNVTVVQKATWSEAGVRILHLSPDTNRGSHSLTRVGEGSRTPIECVRLDDYLESIGVDHVDIMKIDVEGAEAYALEGAEGFLREGRIRNIILEWNPDGWQGRQAQLETLFERFHAYRFDPSVPFRRLEGATLPLSEEGPLSYLFLQLKDH